MAEGCRPWKNRAIGASGHEGTRVTYAYDALGRRTLMADASGTTYSYDAASRLIGLVNAWGERTTFQYDALGRPTLLEQANGTRAT